MNTKISYNFNSCRIRTDNIQVFLNTMSYQAENKIALSLESFFRPYPNAYFLFVKSQAIMSFK